MKEYKIKYVGIGEELAEQIANGKFLAGEKFYSRRQLCSLFKISDVTAVKVQNYLEERGMLRKMRGSGAFVNHLGITKNATEIPGEISFHKIITIQEKGSEHFGDELESGIDLEAGRLGIDYELQLVRPTTISLQKINAISGLPGIGYIIIAAGPESILHSGALLLNPGINTVLLDSIIAGSHCVVSDSYNGMRQIIEYLLERGCERFIFAENCMRHPEPFYSSERRDAAAEHCRIHGKECILISSGSFQEIFETLELSDRKKTAVMFPQDDHALRFKKLAVSKGIKLPFITGYDDYAEYMNGLENLTTLRVPREEMGRTAVRLLRESASLYKKIVRVQGQLIIRDGESS